MIKKRITTPQQRIATTKEGVIRDLEDMVRKIRNRLDDKNEKIPMADRHLLRGRISGLQTAIHAIDDWIVIEEESHAPEQTDTGRTSSETPRKTTARLDHHRRATHSGNEDPVLGRQRRTG